MAYQRVEWQSGTKVADGYVEINGTKHTTVQPQYSGATPINPASLNIMDKGIFDNSQDIEQNTQDIQENTQDIQENRNILNGLASAGCLYVEDIQCRNLFNKNTITEGVCLNGDGTTREASNFCISDYIPVKMLKKYTYQGLTNVGNETYSEFYSSNKTFISSFQQQTAINTITIPIGAAYVRFSIRTGSSDQDTFQIEPGEVATDYTEHKEFGYTNSDLIKKLFNIPSERLHSTDNIDNFYNELGVKVYSIWDELPIGMPTGAYVYGCLVVITQSLTNYFLNTQIYITDSPAAHGVFFRNGANTNWAKLTSTSVSKKTS